MMNLNAARLHSINQADPITDERAAKENELITALKEGRKDFSDMNLSGLCFKRLDLSGCNFSGANLQGWQVDYLTLNGANFSGTDWSRARLTEVGATRAVMDGAKFADAFIEGEFYSCSFSDVDLSRARISNSRFRDCNFEKAGLHGIEMEDTSFERVNFNRIEAQRAGNLRKCRFWDVSWTSSAPSLNLSSTTFSGVDFSHSDFWDSDFVKCKFFDSTEFENCSGFIRVTACMFENVNLLPLRHQPQSLWEGGEFRSVVNEFRKSSFLWRKIICWSRVYKSDPALSLDLETYKESIQAFDSVERKYLREKVTAILAQRSDLATPEALELFEEIKKLDDELPAREPAVGKYAYPDSESIYTSRTRYINAFLKQEKVVDLSVLSTSTSARKRSGNASDSSSRPDKDTNSFKPG